MRKHALASSGQSLSRRRALRVTATGLGAALLAACSDDEGSSTSENAAGASQSGGSGGAGDALPPDAFAQLSCENAKRQTSQLARGLTVEDFESAGACPLLATPSSVEGPYFYCVDQATSDIAEGLPGALLVVGFRLVDAATCEPIEGAVVDIWHCNAGGYYAGYGGDPDVAVSSPSHVAPAKADENYCRGVQLTNADGIVGFATIFPGWYAGRAVHIHFKVQIDDLSVLTHQLVFSEEVVARAYAHEAYDDEGRTIERVLADDDAIKDRFTISEKDGALFASSNLLVSRT